MAATFALTSCDSDDNEQTIQYGYDYNISYVTDLNANTVLGTEIEGANYIIEYDLINGKAEVTITNLRLTAGGSPISLRIEDATYNYVNGATVISVPNATSLLGGTHTISNFKLSQAMIGIEKMGKVVVYYSISYTVDNRYQVVAVQEHAYLPGTTTVTMNSTGNQILTSKDPYYEYDLDRDTGTADITAYWLSNDKTTYWELEFEDIPYTMTPYGIKIDAEGTFTAEQTSTGSAPFVAKAISMDSRFDGSTVLRIMTDDYLYTASLSYVATTPTPSN